MTTDDIINLLTNFEKRLSTIADQAHEACEQARHTLDRVNLLRRDLRKLKQDLVSTSDTANHHPVRPKKSG